MAYTVNFTDPGKSPYNIDDGAINGPGYGTRNTDLTTFGKSRTNYGEQLNENLVHLLENFAHPQTAPNTPNASILSTPLEGQLWYNKTTKNVLVYNGTSWINLKGVISSGTAPSAPQQGDLWYDITVPQLKVYTGSAFVSVALRYLQLDGTTSMTGALNMGTQKITNLGPPTATTDAATKAYADARVSKAGDTMSGTLTMSGGNIVVDPGFRITHNSGTPATTSHEYRYTSGSDHQMRIVVGNAAAATRQVVYGYETVYGDPASFVQVANLSMTGVLTVPAIAATTISTSGQINVNNNKIVGVATPTVATDAVNKTYVDAMIAAAITHVGQIIITRNASFNPNTQYAGTTWTKFAPGRTLVGQLTGDPDFGALDGEVGAKTVALTAANNGPHTHSGVLQEAQAGQRRIDLNRVSGQDLNFATGNNSFDTTDSSGSGTPHNNIQPSKVVIFWTRTA